MYSIDLYRLAVDQNLTGEDLHELLCGPIISWFHREQNIIYGSEWSWSTEVMEVPHQYSVRDSVVTDVDGIQLPRYIHVVRQEDFLAFLLRWGAAGARD